MAARMAMQEPPAPSGEDSARDRRILAGLLRNRTALLAELAREGMSRATVLRRAADLGLSEAVLRHEEIVARELAAGQQRAARSALAPRNCLACDRVFLSTGPGNRLCTRC
jgi:hypothetical protein